MTPHADAAIAMPDAHEAGRPLQQVCADMDGFPILDDSHLVELENRSLLRYTPDEELHDLICVGFGPASLAIAAALHDALDGSDPSLDILGLNTRNPKVAFLEKQHQFQWHAGMLLPGAKMQISFMKDMATMRNPRSKFTFINYLFKHQRLAEFMNLDTFLPSRVEYEDYMRWCATWFDEVVHYGEEVVKVIPSKSKTETGQINTFEVVSRALDTGKLRLRRARHVVIAAGGKPNVPKPFPANHPKVVHSSQFQHISSRLLNDTQYPYSIAVVGNGQSAAEIFDYLHSHYPNSRTRLLIKQGALRPSDDSPFVNEIFNPDRVDSTFSRAPALRIASIQEDRNTNYGVVRLNLLEHIYETLYMQRIRYGNSSAAEEHWPHRILPYRLVSDVQDSPVVKGGIRLHVRDQSPLYLSRMPSAQEREEIMDFDAVFVATGYHRDLHERLLHDARDLMPGGDVEDAKWQVQRDYRVHFANNKVSNDAGIWLQGCCETSHGLSDTLLSILATRGGQIVKSIFAKHQKGNVADGMSNEKLRQ